LRELRQVLLLVELHEHAPLNGPEKLRRGKSAGERGVATAVGWDDGVEDARLAVGREAAALQRLQEVGGGEVGIDRLVGRPRAVADIGDAYRVGSVEVPQIAGGCDGWRHDRNEEGRQLGAGGQEPPGDVGAGALDGGCPAALFELPDALRRDELVAPACRDGRLEAGPKAGVRELDWCRRPCGQRSVVAEQSYLGDWRGAVDR